jgi:hypothetical protein
VVSSAAVADGTPRIASADAERFDAAFAAVRALARERIGEPWLSRAPEEGDAGRRLL